MRLDIERLDATGEKFAHTYSPDEISLNDERARLLTGPNVTGKAARRGDGVRVRGKIAAQVEVECDRCVSPVNVDVDVDFDTTFISPAEAAAFTDNLELESLDLDSSVHEGDAVDIDQLVTEQILLALPSRQLCSDACQGLCPSCGLNLNEGQCNCASKEIDPRWSKLAEMKEEKKS